MTRKSEDDSIRLLKNQTFAKLVKKVLGSDTPGSDTPGALCIAKCRKKLPSVASFTQFPIETHCTDSSK